MTLVDRVIASLRAHHDQLAELVPTLDADALAAPSGASQWRVCDVLSHLGSGAEIMVRPVTAAVSGTALPEPDNQAIWARWDAASPQEQAAWVLEHDAVMVEQLEAIDEDTRATLQVDLGFLPAPVPLAMAAGMRLNEVALHVWDVKVAFDPEAGVDAEAADILLELFAGPMAMMMQWSSKPDALSEPAVVALAGHGLAIGDGVSLVAEPPIAPTATFSGPAEAAVRLISGRLSLAHTPDDVAVTGNVTLDELRAVFPGY